MKNAVFIAFLCCIVSGCGVYERPTNPLVQSLRQQRQQLDNELSMLMQELELLDAEQYVYNDCEARFARSLNDEQLNAFEALISGLNEKIHSRVFATNSSDLGQISHISEQRKLSKLLPADKASELEELINRKQELGEKWATLAYKIRWHQQRESQFRAQANLAYQTQLELNRQTAQRRAENQRMWQEYYRQQGLQQSLSGIEDAIRSQGDGIPVIRYNPATDPQIYFRDGLMQGLGLPPPQ